jgi:hypothetical protein
VVVFSSIYERKEPEQSYGKHPRWALGTASTIRDFALEFRPHWPEDQSPEHRHTLANYNNAEATRDKQPVRTPALVGGS